jgi:hypothetical protein
MKKVIMEYIKDHNDDLYVQSHRDYHFGATLRNGEEVDKYLDRFAVGNFGEAPEPILGAFRTCDDSKEYNDVLKFFKKAIDDCNSKLQIKSSDDIVYAIGLIGWYKDTKILFITILNKEQKRKLGNKIVY